MYLYSKLNIHTVFVFLILTPQSTLFLPIHFCGNQLFHSLVKYGTNYLQVSQMTSVSSLQHPLQPPSPLLISLKAGKRPQTRSEHQIKTEGEVLLHPDQSVRIPSLLTFLFPLPSCFQKNSIPGCLYSRLFTFQPVSFSNCLSPSSHIHSSFDVGSIRERFHGPLNKLFSCFLYCCPWQYCCLLFINLFMYLLIYSNIQNIKCLIIK